MHFEVFFLNLSLSVYLIVQGGTFLFEGRYSDTDYRTTCRQKMSTMVCNATHLAHYTAVPYSRGHQQSRVSAWYIWVSKYVCAWYIG